jgi:peroxiredoxin
MTARPVAVLSLLVVAGLTLPAWSQEAPAPAQPAPAVAQPALQKDARAVELLQAASDTIKKMNSLRFRSFQTLEGAPQLSMRGEGEIKFIRNQAAPSVSAVWIKGDIQLPMSPLVSYHAMFDGKLASWVDTQNKVVNDQPAPVSDSVRAVKNPKDRLVPNAFFELEPFGGELRSEGLVYEGEAEVRGQPCHVVRAISSNRQRETKIWLGVNDNFPRRIEQISTHRTGKASYINELWDLDVSPISPSDLAIATPEGYTRKELDPAAPPKPFNPSAMREGGAAKGGPEGATGQAQRADPATVPPAVRRAQINAQRAREGLPPLGPNDPLPEPAVATPAPATPAAPAAPVASNAGLAPGTDAPLWALQQLDGGTEPITLASLRGRTVVLAFWGSLFAQSRGLLTSVEELSKGLAGQPVAIYAVACRTAEGQVRDYLKQNNFTMPVLLNGDPVARDYQIRGFPATVIIGPDGKISSVIPGSANPQVLQIAITQAQSKAPGQ